MRGRVYFPKRLGGRSAELDLSDRGQKIVDVLHDVLRASVVLVDRKKRERHHLAYSPDRPLSNDGLTLDVRRMCKLSAPVKDGWTLVVSGPLGLHPDAESLVKWAAEKLAPHVPNKTTDGDDDDDEPSPPPGGGGGGSGGAAEIGIPVWWARKTRSS
jgi:hypothetical protein